MPTPLQVTFADVDPSPAVEARIRELHEKLDSLHGGIMSCRVVVRAPHRHQRKGRLYHVSIDLKIPGQEIAVNRDPPEQQAHQDIYVAVRDAFNAAGRQLREVTRRGRGEVKAHEVEPHGKVIRLFPQDGYGFIQGTEGDDIYFHANSVQKGRFGQLEIGDEVRYCVSIGEKGAQATVVKPVGKHHLVP